MTDQDLFDDSTMSFGEHLEALRSHLILALIGFAIAMIAMLFCSRPVMKLVTSPVESALKNALLKQHGDAEQKKLAGSVNPVLRTWSDFWKGESGVSTLPIEILKKASGVTELPSLKFDLNIGKVLTMIHEIQPEIPAPPADLKPKNLTLEIPYEQLAPLLPKSSLADRVLAKPSTYSVEEGFMIYMKVAMIAGFVVSSPWVFYQLWLFVAAGLYPHERKYIYIYLPFSIVLFLTGSVFCFLVVLPYVLDFLFDFTIWLDLHPQIRLNEWLGFALIMPVMFGLSFELPLIMLFLERISIFKPQDYVEKRRIAILVIAFISMVLTPSDPVSMLLMLIPLCLLYELGIFLCRLQPPHATVED